LIITHPILYYPKLHPVHLHTDLPNFPDEYSGSYTTTAHDAYAELAESYNLKYSETTHIGHNLLRLWHYQTYRQSL